MTEWENPVSARDKVRVAFRDAGRNYVVEGQAYDPVGTVRVLSSPSHGQGAHQVVRPLHLHDPELKWWVPLSEQNFGDPETSVSESPSEIEPKNTDEGEIKKEEATLRQRVKVEGSEQ